MSSAAPPPPKQRQSSGPAIARGTVSTTLVGSVLAVTLVLVALGARGGDRGQEASATRGDTTAPVAPPSSGGSSAPARPRASPAPSPPPASSRARKPPARPRASPRPRVGSTASPSPRQRTFLVSRVVDGDTLELAGGQGVRIVGVDTPERGECGYDEATAALERLVLGRRVRLTVSDEDRDRYGRLLRYVDVGRVDAGLRQIKAGLATARYDSRDGYGRHPREERYVTADRRARNPLCGRPRPLTSRADGHCAVGYSPCLPVVDDLDCADVDGAVRVSGTDEYGLDRDGDGVGCDG